MQTIQSQREAFIQNTMGTKWSVLQPKGKNSKIEDDDLMPDEEAWIRKLHFFLFIFYQAPWFQVCNIFKVSFKITNVEELFFQDIYVC